MRSSVSLSLSTLSEQRYRRNFLVGDAKQNAAAILILGVIYGGVAMFNDRLMLAPGLILTLALLGRAITVVGSIVVVILLRRLKSPRQFDLLLAVWFVGMALVYCPVQLTRLPLGEHLGPLTGTVVGVCVFFFAMRGQLWPRLLLSTVATVMALVLLWNPLAVVSPAGRIMSTFALVTINLVGIVAARGFEEQRRKRFDAERQERLARQELSLKLRELAIEKERAESMSQARTAFLAAMSHEFRTPMNAVIGLSELLLAVPPSALAQDENRHHIRTISDSARALLGMLNDILDFAKIDAQKLSLSPVSFSLAKLADSVHDMLLPAAQAKGVSMRLKLSPELPDAVIGDDARLRQVLVNLLSNAIKFTEHGTVGLDVTATMLPSSPSTTDARYEVTFRAHDSGIGIPAKKLQNLFRPFEQGDSGTRRRYGGTGLGLAISQQIVQAMGSEIRVESEPGRGSAFSFTVTLVQAPTPQVSPQPRSSEPSDRPVSARLRVLVVDDNPVNRRVASAWLERLGHDVDLATGGNEAIRAVEGNEYDAVFMDVHMPEMNGIEATQRIVESMGPQRVPPIVAMTAAVFEEDREACLKAGMTDFLAKPIHFAQLGPLLTRLVDERARRLTGTVAVGSSPPSENSDSAAL